MWKLSRIFLMMALLCASSIIVLTLFIINQNTISAYQFPLQPKWTFEADAQITTTPLIYRDQVLIRTSSKLYVIDVLTGRLIWSFSLSMDKHADPPLVQDDIIILSHLSGTTALTLATGEIIWEVLDKDTRVDALPIGSNENVVVIANDDILIRDINTGKLLWKIENPYHRSNAVGFLDEEYLYIIFRDQIRGYDVETGTLLWNRPTEEWSLRTSLSGLLEDGVLYLERRQEGISAYHIKDQKILWERNDLSISKYPITKYQNTLFIGSRGDVPIAISVTTGKTLWEAKEVFSYDTYQTPLIFDDMVYIRGLFLKKIYALNINTGMLIGYINLGLPDLVSRNAAYSLGPVRYDEQLIIFPANNKLLAYENGDK